MSEYGGTFRFTTVERAAEAQTGTAFVALTRVEVEQLLRVYRAALELDPRAAVAVINGEYQQRERRRLKDLAKALDGYDPRPEATSFEMRRAVNAHFSDGSLSAKPGSFVQPGPWHYFVDGSEVDLDTYEARLREAKR